MKYKFIAIEREYASGGRIIGEEVAANLSMPCYGNEILLMAAERAGVSAESLQEYEESANNSLLYTLFRMGQLGSTKNEMPVRDELLLMESTIITEIAAKEQPCVFVGRAAHSVLIERDDVLSVFVYSDLASRKKRAIESYGVFPAEAALTLRKYDHRRANYYKSYSGKTWNDKSQYHMMLNSSILSIEECAASIMSAVL
ncbi:MAG: AAA family ATPase [Oscillospiraceae bacterium]